MSNLTSLTPILEKHNNKRAAQIVSAIAVYEAAIKPMYLWGYHKYHEKFTKSYTVKLSQKDEMYDHVMKWLYDHLADKDKESLKVESSKKDLLVYFDSDAPATIELEGHKIEITSGNQPKKNEAMYDDDDDGLATLVNSYISDFVTFTAKTSAGRMAILMFLDEQRKEYWSDTNPPRVMIPGRYGTWDCQWDTVERPLSSVILKGGQLERITNDLDKFLAAEDQYVALGIPYHRGYLFHGPPGTGKTSIAKAVSHHYHMDVYYLPLAALKDDINLLNLINQIPARSVLLIEDVDIYTAMTNRKQLDDNRPTLASMLNALDGIYTPHGLITVMTTNNLKKLDPAVRRPGRSDMIEEFSNLDEHQVDALVGYMEVEGDFNKFVGESPAALVEEIKSLKL